MLIQKVLTFGQVLLFSQWVVSLRVLGVIPQCPDCASEKKDVNDKYVIADRTNLFQKAPDKLCPMWMAWYCREARRVRLRERVTIKSVVFIFIFIFIHSLETQTWLYKDVELIHFASASWAVVGPSKAAPRPVPPCSFGDWVIKELNQAAPSYFSPSHQTAWINEKM